MEGWRISNNWWKFSHLSLQLADAIKNEDAEKFLEIYDDVMPKNLTPIEVEEIKEKARELASLPDEDFHRVELQLQVPDTPNASGESTGQSVNSLPTSCASISNKLATPEPNNPGGDTTASVSHDQPTLEDHCQPLNDVCAHKKSSLDLKNSLDLSARERTKPSVVRKRIPGPQFIASEPSEISLPHGLNFLLNCDGSDGVDDGNHMTETYSKISFANHNRDEINFTSDESSDSLTFRERSLDDLCDSDSSYPSYHELCSERLTTSAKLSQRNIQSQQSRYRQSSFTLVTDVKKNPKTEVENEQVKNNPESSRKRKKKKKKGKVTKMDENKSGKATSTEVSTGIVFDVFTQNNVKKVKSAVDRKQMPTEKTLLNECGLKKVDNCEVEVRMDALKHNQVVNNRKQDTAVISDSDSDDLREIVIMGKGPINKCTESSSLRSDDALNRRYDTFGPPFAPPFEYPPNTDKLTNSAMSLIDEKHKGSRDIEMQIMSSLETPIQNDPRRRVQTTKYIASATAGKITSMRDLKSILKSTSNNVCDDNAKIPAASVKERFDDLDMRSLSNNHYILSDGDTEANKKKKKSKKKKKKDDEAEDDSIVREPERKLKSALAPRKDTFMDTHIRDYPNEQDNEPYLTADGIRNIDIGSKNCRTKKKREITSTAPPSVINNRSAHAYSQGRSQKCEDIKKRLQERLSAKSHGSAIERHSDTNMRMEYHVDAAKKSSVTVKEDNEFDWITDPATLSMFGLTKNNNKEKKNPKKKKKTVDYKKEGGTDVVTHSDSEVKGLKAKDSNERVQKETLRKSASFDIEENASSSEEDNNDEKEFQVVQSKKKKAAKKRVIFEDKSASFPRNMVAKYPKERASSYLAASCNLRKCKSEPMTLVQDDVEGVCTGFGTGTSSGSQSSASSISTDPPSSQSYLEMAVAPQPNTEPTPLFEFSYASKVKGASPKNEQTIATKLATESVANPVESKGCDDDKEDIDSVVELAGESTPVHCAEESAVEKPAKDAKPQHTKLTFINKPTDIKSDHVTVAANSDISTTLPQKNNPEPEVLHNQIKKGDKKKEIGSDVLVNGINTELIINVGDKSSKLPCVNPDSVGIGITFGSIVFHNDNSFSLEDNEESKVRGSPARGNPAPDSPVDKLMASAQNAIYPTEPSTVITCTALENSLVRENSEASKINSVKEVVAINNIGSFNHLTIAKFLQEEWEKVLEEAATNPGCVVYLKH